MEHHLHNHIAQKLSAELGEKVKIDTAKSLGGGCINHASCLKTSAGDFFLKWNQTATPDIFIREAECLRELAKAETELYIPEVFLATEPQDELPAFLLTEFLQPPTSNQTALDEKLGRGIAQLHRFQNDQYGFYHDNYCGATPQLNHWGDDWIVFFGQQRIHELVKMIRQERGLDKSSLKIYDQLIQKLPQLIGHVPPASLNHGDLWSGNYMHSVRGPALIDPASYYADREFDLAMMGMFGGFSERVWEAYQEEYPLENAWKERHNLYMLYHYLNHYYLFGGGYGQQSLSIARKYL